MYWIFFHRSRFLSNLRSPWNNRVALKFFTVLNILFTFRFFNNLRLPWKQSFPWNFSLHWIYFLPFRIFEKVCACPEKQSCPGIFRYIEFTFYIQEFWATCMRLPWKTEGALNSQYLLYIFIIQDFWATCAFSEKRSCLGIFHCIEIFFIIQDFWATCACPENQSCQKFFAVWNILFTFRIFKQLALALKNRGCPEFTILNMYFFYYSGFGSNLRFPWKTGALKFFAVLNIFFIILEFWVTCACLKTELHRKFSLYWVYFLHSEFLSSLQLPWKTEGALNLLYWMYIFYYSGFLSNLRLPWKTELPWNFSLYWNIFRSFLFRIFSNLRLPWKQSLSWNFSSLEERQPPWPPASYAYVCRLIVYFIGSQLVFDWDRLENLLITRNRPVSNKVTNTISYAKVEYHMYKYSAPSPLMHRQQAKCLLRLNRDCHAIIYRASLWSATAIAYRHQRWADCKIFQSESSPDPMKFNLIQSWSTKFLKITSPIQSWSAKVKSCIFILPHEAKELELFCLYSNMIGWRQNSFSSVFASWGKIDTAFGITKFNKVSIWHQKEKRCWSYFAIGKIRLLGLIKWQGRYTWISVRPLLHDLKP